MRAVNLIPAAQRGGTPVGSGRSEGGAYAVLALLAGFAVMAFMYGSAHRSISSDRSQATAVAVQVQQAQSAAQALAPYTAFASMSEQRTQAVSTLVASRFDWAHVFHEFARVLPLGVSISSLSGAVGSVAAAPVATPAPSPAASAAPAGSTAATPAAATTASATPSATSATPPGSIPTFTLSGCARTQQEVAKALVRLRLMDGVNAVELQSSTKGATGGGCPATSPVFTALVTFDALPTPPAHPTSTKSASVSVSTTADVSPASSGSAAR